MNDTLPRQRLNDWEDLRVRWGIKDSKPTIYRKVRAGKFPQPVYIGKAPAWTDEQLAQFIAAAAGASEVA